MAKLQLVHVQAFLAVAETLSFSAAAKRLHLAPSRISERIHEAETTLGAHLFQRTSRRTSLTAAGEALLPHAVQIVRQMEAVEAIFRTEARPALRVGARSLPPDFRRELLHEVLEPAAAPTPVSLQPLESDRQLRLLRSGRLELGLLWHAVDDPDLAQVPVLQERFMVAVPATARYAALERVQPTDLVGLRLALTVDVRRLPTSFAPFLQVLPHVDRVDPAVEDGIAMLLGDGQHCTFVPAVREGRRGGLEPDGSRFLVLPVRGPEPTLTTHLTWLRDRAATSPLAEVILAVRERFTAPELR